TSRASDCRIRVTLRAFLISRYDPLRDLHSFPTRRSSDLRSRKARVSYKVQRTINASLNAATSTRAVSSNPNFEACVYGTLDFVRSEERFSRNAETDLVCRLLLEKKNEKKKTRTRMRHK